MDVVMSQDTMSCGCCHVTGHSPPFYYEKNMLSYGCCHVTGHSPRFIMGKICCPVDVVMLQDTPPLLLLLKT